jgi:hypothetical protein
MNNSDANIQCVHNLYAAFARLDLSAILATLEENVDWFFVGQPDVIPYAGVRHGREDVLNFFILLVKTVEVLAFGPLEVRAFADNVLVLGHEKVKVRATGKVFETDWAHLFTLSQGKIVRLRGFYDTATMAAAFRL